MMNLIALSLVATSFAVAGVFSPNPQTNNGKEQVIVKDGHRAVVVEYADTAGDGNTKVLISPSHPSQAGNAAIEDQLSRATASVAGVAQDAKGKAQEALHAAPNGPYGAGPRELICDAYGKCKHKIAGVWGKAKDKVVEAEEEVKDVVEGAVDKAKDFASRAAHKAEEGAEGVRESAKEKVGEVREGAERVKGKAGEKMRETGDMARETAEKVKGKTGEMAGKVKGKTGEVVEETAEKIKEQGRKGKKELSDIAKRGKEVVFDAIRYVFWPESMSSVMRMIQMLGFATAYGVSVWVTFIMSHVLAGALPRQQFGMVQSKIYPVYFKAMVGSIGLALLGHLLGQRSKVFKNKSEMLQSYILMASMLSPLANLLFLEPKATKVMFERMKLEKEEGRGRDRNSTPTRVIDTDHTVVTDTAGPVPTTSTTTGTAATTTTTTTPAQPRSEQDVAKSKMDKLDERLKKLNSYSSLLNIMTLMGLTWHLVYLSQRLGVDTY